MAFSAKVLKDYGAVGTYRVRLLHDEKKPDATPIMDIREYITAEKFEGFTRRGVRIGSEEGAKLLIAALEDAVQNRVFGRKP